VWVQKKYQEEKHVTRNDDDDDDDNNAIKLLAGWLEFDCRQEH